MDNYLHSFDDKNVKITRQYGKNETDEEFSIAQDLINKMWRKLDTKKINYTNLEINESFTADDFLYELEGLFGGGKVWANIVRGTCKYDFERSYIGRWVDLEKVIPRFLHIKDTYGLMGVVHEGFLYVWCPFSVYGLVMQNNDCRVKDLLHTREYPLSFLFDSDHLKNLIPDVRNIDWLAQNVRVFLTSLKV
jgi:hypothetical protein